VERSEEERGEGGRKRGFAKNVPKGVRENPRIIEEAQGEKRSP